MKKAADSGQSVEVAGDTTPTERVVANPGGTFTLEADTTPVRAEQNGTWVPLDTTLQSATDSLIRPKAAAVDVAFSAGGASTPLATVTSDGESYSISSPWTLPAPTISGSTATYASVLPDVDLVVAAVPDGFTENVVVKTRAAAQNAGLAKLRFPIITHGLQVREGSTGVAALVDEAGRPVFTSGSAVQWDSAPAPATQATRQTARALTATEPADATQEPAPGSRTTAMDVSIDATAMTVTPDQQFLTDPATVYPVVLDPQTDNASLTGWTALWSNESTTSFWKTTHTLGVGYDAYVDNKKVESLYQFDTHKVAGKKILEATFTAEEVWSANCTGKRVDLWRTTAISSSTTWSKPPGWQSDVDHVTAAKGYSSGCPGGNVSFNATSAVAVTANASSATTTLGLKAYDEGDPIAWKQFASPANTVPTLSITYVSAPSLPTSVRVSNPNVGCATTWQNPAVIRDTTPTFSAAPKSSDGSQATLRPDFEVIDIAPSPDVVVQSGNPSAWTASGTAGTWATPNALTSGKIYAVVARSEYHYSWDGITGTTYSPYTMSHYCYFKVDINAPPMPTITPVTSTVTYYPCADEDHPDTCTANGGVGVPGSFKITAGAPDVVKYVYTLNGETAVTKTFTTGTPSYTPPPIVPDIRGVNTLQVWTYDAAGNTASQSGHYTFNVAAGAPPVDAWSFAEGSGSTAADSAGGKTATLADGAAWSSQARLGTAFQGNGSTAYAASTTSAVDTSTSFSVSAWVRLTSLANNSTFLAQRGTNADGFQLYYSNSCGWAFNRHSADVYDPAIIRTCVPATANVWTHLLGVYDAQAQKLKLYVNGVNDPTKDVAFTTPWKATGPVDFGRRLYKGAFGEYVQGNLDEVQIWNRVMSPQEVDDLQAVTDANGKARPQLAASWGMNDAAGSTTAADSSVYGHTATVGSGASFTQDTDSGMGPVLSLNGAVNAYASAAGPVVDAQGGFTVSVWVNLDSTAFTDTAARTMRIISQTGSNSDTWSLWYQKAANQSQGSWVFGRTAADTARAVATTAPQNVAAAALTDPGGWTLLTGVYDSATQQMYLYVNGVPQGVTGNDENDGSIGDGTAFTAPWQASGPLLIGEGRNSSGAVGDATAGEVAKARVWIGTTSPADIMQMFTDELPIPS